MKAIIAPSALSVFHAGESEQAIGKKTGHDEAKQRAGDAAENREQVGQRLALSRHRSFVPQTPEPEYNGAGVSVSLAVTSSQRRGAP
jgi:hypothetical protein